MTTIFRVLGVVAALILCFACDHKSDVVRPQGVPPEATYVLGGKFGGWWQQCMSATGDESAHCRIWNGAGLILVDEEFIPYDGGAPPSVEELKIAPEPTFPGPDRIFLSNGRILLPRSRFEELKIFVDWLKGKRSTAR